jgi:hypothetical protein
MMVVRGALIALVLCLAGPALAQTAANKARATLKDCLDKLPLDKLSDETAIADCLGQAQGAADKDRNRQGQIEFNRRLDDMDRLIERTTRGSRTVLPPVR